MIYPGKNKTPERVFRTMRNFHQGFPWTGDSGMGVVSSNSSFNPAFKVYSLPLSDMSRPQSNKYDIFDQYFDEFRAKFKIGDLVNAIIINKQHSDPDKAGILGKLHQYSVDYENKRIRIFVISDVDNEIYEVYPETIFSRDGLYEMIMNRFEENYNVLRS